MAGIEASQEKKDEETPQPQEPEAIKDEPSEPVEMVNKNRKVCFKFKLLKRRSVFFKFVLLMQGKISSSMGMKRKNVSSLMAKWKKVKQDWD